MIFIKKHYFIITVFVLFLTIPSQAIQPNSSKIEIQILKELHNEGLISQTQYDSSKRQAVWETVSSNSSKSINAGMGSISGQITVGIDEAVTGIDISQLSFDCKYRTS